MWAAAQGHAPMVAMLHRGRRRRERALDHRRLGAAAHAGAARQVAAARRAHAAAVRRARGLRGVRRRARRRQGRHQRRRSRSAERAGPRAHQRPLRRRRRADRPRHRREHEGQGRPDGAVGGRGRAHDAGVEPPGAARDRRRAVEPRRHQDAAGARAPTSTRRSRSRFPIAPSSIAAATACSAPARRRCCARPRPATCR